MDKIYSRKRIKIPKIILYKSMQNKIPNYNIKLRKTIKTTVIIIIAVITMIRSIKGLEPIFDTICKAEAKSIATQVSNNKSTEVMKKYEYEDLATIIRDENGNVIMVKSNVIAINKIISDVAVEIQKELDNIKDKDIGIRMGTITGSKFLSGMGPEVKLQISGVGDVITDFRSEFTQAGINQTLHRIYLQVECNVNILTPFNTIEENIANQVILAENIIVGTTPSTYYNFEGMTDSSQVLETVE